MSTRTTLSAVAAWSLLALAGPGSAQEVNSDVKIPPPREVVTSVPVLNGLSTDPASLFTVQGQVFQGVVSQASSGVLSEGETRNELGDFMMSLLVRAGIIAFDREPARRAASGEDPEDGSRPAWNGRAPMALSVSRTARSEAMRRR